MSIYFAAMIKKIDSSLLSGSFVTKFSLDSPTMAEELTACSDKKRILAGLRCVFLSGPAAGFFIFVGENGENLFMIKKIFVEVLVSRTQSKHDLRP